MKGRKRKETPAPNHDMKSDNLTIHEPTGQEGDTEYMVTISDADALGSGFGGKGNTLIEAVKNCLNVRGGQMPEHLSDYERKTIQRILATGK